MIVLCLAQKQADHDYDASKLYRSKILTLRLKNPCVESIHNQMT